MSLTDQLKRILPDRGKDYAPDDLNRHRQGALMAEVLQLLLHYSPEPATEIERRALVRVHSLIAEKFTRSIEAMWAGRWKEDTDVDEAGYRVVGAALFAGKTVAQFLDELSSEDQQQKADEPLNYDDPPEEGLASGKFQAALDQMRTGVVASEYFFAYDFAGEIPTYMCLRRDEAGRWVDITPYPDGSPLAPAEQPEPVPTTDHDCTGCC